MDPLDPLGIAALIVAGAAAGFLNTLAGGGSLLTLPALMLVGLPASVANATNRLGILMQTLSAVQGFRGAGALPARTALRLALPTLAGAALGAILAARLPEALLEPLLLATLVAMALLFALRPGILARPPDSGDARRAGWRPLLALAGAGFYGGFLQAGVGFVLLAVLGGVLRYDPVRANALKMSLALAFTVVALAIFLTAGLVRWGPGLVLGAGMVVGARLGVRFAVARPEALRWVVLAAVLATTLAVAVRSA